MKNRLILLLIATSTIIQAQVNYLDIRENFTLSCGTYDSLDIVNNQTFIDSVSQIGINHGEEKFLYDKAWLFFCKYQYWNDINDYQTAFDIWNENWLKHQNLSSLWNMSGAVKLIDCERSIELTELFIKNANYLDKDISDKYEQIYFRYKRCYSELIKTNANKK